MSLDAPRTTLLLVFALLTALLVASKATRARFPLRGQLPSTWLLLLSLGVSEFFSFRAGIWILAVLCFVALKEYFTLVDVRWQDRWALLGAYASIPFTIYFIQINWYGMFIISVPVYAFLVIPFLVALGGKETKGSVLSVGMIDFGLFLFVYCVGHLGYLALYSTWWALAVVAAVLVCDLVACLVQTARAPGLGRTAVRCLVAAPVSVLLFWGLSDWTDIPLRHSIALGLMIPVLASIGRFTIAHLEVDLGIDRVRAVPGKGLYVDALRSFLYVSPVAFHYLRYFVA
jgi:phosphatidate cytidylyltransferase